MIGYGPEEEGFALELTYNYGIDSYKNGDDLQHICLQRDVEATKAKAQAEGESERERAGYERERGGRREGGKGVERKKRGRERAGRETGRYIYLREEVKERGQREGGGAR